MHRRLNAAVVALLALVSCAAMAQDWPRPRPVQFLVAFGPGSTTDTVTRLVAQKMAEHIGQSVVVENKPGAGGNIAARLAKGAPPDGHTVLAVSVAFAVNPGLYADAGYDPLRDFAPVVLGPSTPNIIAVHPSLPVKTIGELVAYARANKLSYASSGIGTTTHLSMERLKTAARLDITHVPYQPAQAIGAVVAGHTQVSSTSMPPAVPQVRAGKLRALAVTSAQRSPALPEVPTMNESGYGGFDDLTWIGFFVPAGTPEAVVARVNAEIARALEMPDVKDRLAQLGLDFRRNSPVDFGAYLRSEIAKWAQAVKDSGAKAD
jgi:tripartite-type tricarboxylate transporter receptor subunit TctC